MTNPNKGEIEFKAGEKTYILRYSIDAICHLEAKTGKTFPTIAVEMANPAKISMTLVRDLLHAGLIENHPEITMKEAGELVLSAGGFLGAMKKVEAAIAAAFPDAVEASGTPRPPNRAVRRAGTGRGS